MRLSQRLNLRLGKLRPRKFTSQAILLAAMGLTSLGLTVNCTSDAEPEQAGENFDQVVYVVRQHTTVDGDTVTIDVAGGNGQMMDYLRYVPGARIEVRNIRTDATLNILQGDRYSQADVVGLDLSFDATSVVFGMKLDGGDHYHVYSATIAPGADGDHDVTQLTYGPQDDLFPVWVAGGRIAFVTNQAYTEMGTRADEYNHSRNVGQIATIADTGAVNQEERTLCSQNLSNTVNLFSMANGQVGFSRWEHLENVNDLKAFAMNPDCTQMVALSGQHGKPANSLGQITETNTPNVFVAVGSDRENTIQSGALIQIDARNMNDPSRFDEENTAYTVLTPAVPRGREDSPVGRYRTPAVLPDGRILVSWADGRVNDRDELSLTAPDFGIYIYNPETRENERVVNHSETWELHAHAVAVRAEPPVLAQIQNSQDPTLPLTIGSVDIANTSLGSLHGETVSGAQFDGTPMGAARRQAVKVRIIAGFSSEGAPGVTMFGLTMAEGAAIIGEATVREDGSWAAEIPPFIPVHLQAVDEFELSIRNQTTWIQGMPGESRICGGCHEERTAANTLADQQLTVAINQVEDFMAPVAQRLEFPWTGTDGYGGEAAAANEMQALLTEKCAGCHNSTTNGNVPQEYYELSMAADVGSDAPATTYRIPRLDLSATPVTVEYDMEVATWPAAYVSIFFPAALEMEMGSEVIGKVPPMWGIPSDARGSAIVEKLNIASSLDANRYAYAMGEPFSNPDIAGGVRTSHPEDQGAEYALTRQERQMLIRTIDMGAQYYSRQNSGFEPYTADPLGTY